MKRKNPFSLPMFVFAALVTFATMAVLACDNTVGPNDDDDIQRDATQPTGEGWLEIGADEYVLSKLYFEHVENRQIDMHLVCDGLTMTESGHTGTGTMLWFELVFPEDSVTAGDFTYESDPDPDDDPNTFSDDSFIALDYEFIPEDWDKHAYLVGGELTISISGTTYTVSGEVELDHPHGDFDHRWATFYYQGPVTDSLWFD